VRFWRHRPPESTDTDLRLVVGLGNPGRQYEHTRHNVGFMTVQKLADRYGMSFKGAKHRADIARGEIDGEPVLLAMPITYMNDSGHAVSHLVQYYHLPIEHVLIILDEMDLPFGTLRLRPSGSAGGHNGLKSIIRELGTEEFARLRVGVGRPQGSAVRHVLQPFSADEARVLPLLIDTAADAAISALQSGVQEAMNRFNRDWLPSLLSNT